MERFLPSAYGRHIADVHDATVSDLSTKATIERLAELAVGGPVLEFGIGTGRLALALAARSVPVTGVEGSAEMLTALRGKAGGTQIPVVVGDFADTQVEGTFRLVVLVLNTIFALPSQAAQVRFFRNAAAHLEPGGRFVVEACVPDPGAFRNGSAVRLLTVADDEVLLEAARLHQADQTMRTTKVRLTQDGIRLLPANHRYAWPAELDLMAELAGMRLEHRWADWHRTPYADHSPAHSR